jgi:iron complex transport system ATP-binding protein
LKVIGLGQNQITPDLEKSAQAIVLDVEQWSHADEMLVMEQGRVVHQGPCADTDTHRALESVFDHRIQVRMVDGQAMALPLSTRR